MIPIKVKRNPPQRVIHPIPSHNGFGSEEDSLLNVFYLNPAGKIHEYYTPKDLILGNYVNVFNRLCRLIDCDDYTKKWYKEK